MRNTPEGWSALKLIRRFQKKTAVQVGIQSRIYIHSSIFRTLHILCMKPYYILKFKQLLNTTYINQNCSYSKKKLIWSKIQTVHCFNFNLNPSKYNLKKFGYKNVISHFIAIKIKCSINISIRLFDLYNYIAVHNYINCGYYIWYFP